MSDLREIRLQASRPHSAEPVASDGSTLTVIRDAQGQIREASGRGRDGVVRRLTVTSKSAINPAGFHFVGTQFDFYEDGKEYLRLGAILSPDAGKMSFQAYSGTSQFGFAVGIPRTRSQATVVTTTGSRVTVDLSKVSPLSALTQEPSSSMPAPSIQGRLTPPPQGIQEAFRKAGYFQPLIERERAQLAADLDRALNAVNLSATMHADLRVSRFDGITSQGNSPGKSSGSNAQDGAAVVVLAGSAAATGAAVAIGIVESLGLTLSLAVGATIIVGVGLAMAAIAVAAIAIFGSPVDPPTGTDDTPPADVVPSPLQTPNADQPPQDGGPQNDAQQPPQDTGPQGDAQQNQTDVSAWDSLPDEGWASTPGDASPVGVASGGPSDGGSDGGGRSGGGDAGSGSGEGASGSPSGSGSSGSGDSGSGGSGSGDSGSGGSGSGGSEGGGSSGSEGGGSGGGESGGGESGGGGDSGGGGGGGESIGTGGVLKKPEEEGGSSNTSSSASSTQKRPPEPPPTI